MQARVDAWLDPFGHDTDGSVPDHQGLYGMAWGGLVGRGLGQGSPTRIPFAYSDFIMPRSARSSA